MKKGDEPVDRLREWRPQCTAACVLKSKWRRLLNL